MFAFSHRGGVQIWFGRQELEADLDRLASARTLVFCAVLSHSSPLIPAAPLKKPAIDRRRRREQTHESRSCVWNLNVAAVVERTSLTNIRSLQTPEFALSLIFPRESRRGWWPETRPQLALLWLYCWRGAALLVGVAVHASPRLGPPGAQVHRTGLDLRRDRPASLRAEHLLEMGAERLALRMGGVYDAVTFSLFSVWMFVYSPSVPPAFIHSFLRNVRILSPFHLTERFFCKLCFEKTCWGTV